MSNVQWRKYRLESLSLINQMREGSLLGYFSNELDRIVEHLDNQDYINATPKVFYEAPNIDLDSLNKEIKEKYLKILERSKRFRPL